MDYYWQLVGLLRVQPAPLDQIRQQVVNASDIQKDNALGIAVFFANEQVVQLLLEQNAYADALIYMGAVHLITQDDLRALDRDNPGILQIPKRWRVLHHAFERRYIPIMKMLVMAGATITKQYKHGRILTDIMREALTRRDREMIDTVLMSVISRTISSGRGPGPEEQIILDELWEASTVLKLPDPTRLHTFVTADSDSPLVQWFPEYAQSADEAQKDLALAYAVHYRKTDMVEILLKHNANPNGAELMRVYDYPDERDRTLRQNDFWDGISVDYNSSLDRVFQQAYYRKDVDMMRLLLNANASLRFYYGRVLDTLGLLTVPMHAMHVDDKEMLTFFVAHGWDVNERAPACHQQTPLNSACFRENNVFIEYFLNEGAHPDMQCGLFGRFTNVHVCIERGNREGLKLLMRHGVEINVYDSSFYNALATAIESYLICEENDVNDEGDELSRRSEIIKDILEYNVDFDYPDRIEVNMEFDYEVDVVDNRPVPDVIRDLVNSYRNKQSVDYLRNLRYDQVNVQDAWGKTALHRAVENGQLEAVRVLIVEKHARDDIKDFWGNTAKQALEKRYLAEVSKQQDVGRYVPNHTEEGFRFEQGDALAAAKLPIFRQIGRYLHQQRFFLDKIGPNIRLSNDQTEFPGVIRQIYEILF